MQKSHASCSEQIHMGRSHLYKNKMRSQGLNSVKRYTKFKGNNKITALEEI